MDLTLSLALVAGLLAAGSAEMPITPTAVAYSHSAEESSDAKMCEMTATLTNPVPPERVTLSAFAGYDKNEASIAVGFIVGASRQLPSGSLDMVEVSSAAIVSDNFNSADELDHEVWGEGDGLFLAATADAETANRLLKAVAAGGFYLTVSGNEPDIANWTYKVKAGAPSDIQKGFDQCLGNLEPAIISLRPAKAQLHSAH